VKLESFEQHQFHAIFTRKSVLDDIFPAKENRGFIYREKYHNFFPICSPQQKLTFPNIDQTILIGSDLRNFTSRVAVLDTYQSEISLLSQEKIGTKNNKLLLVNKQEEWVYRCRLLNAFLSRMKHVDGLTVYECDANMSFSVDKIMVSHGNSTTIVFLNHVMTIERILGKNAEYICTIYRV